MPDYQLTERWMKPWGLVKNDVIRGMSDNSKRKEGVPCEENILFIGSGFRNPIYIHTIGRAMVCRDRRTGFSGTACQALRTTVAIRSLRKS
jgi:hypothetical protein